MACNNYLRNAENLYLKRNYPAAFAYFVKYFKTLDNSSETSNAVHQSFTDVVCKIGMVLEEVGDSEELLKVYLQALDVCPNNYTILTNFGCFMYKISEIDAAKTYLEMALELNNNYLPAQKNLMHCKWQQVPRWHFKMLNDRRRNKAYNTAVLSAIDKGFTKIVDVGAGCGLLSLIASQRTQAKVTAIEENKLLSTMMETILKENDIKNVTVINCYSTSLTQAPVDCNCIVTETFDIALFGEHMMESLIHAHDILITEKPFQIVPQKARLFAGAINYKAPQCNRFLDKLAELNLDNICVRTENPEPYDGEDISSKTFAFVTNIVEVLKIDFSNVDQLRNMLSNKEFHKFVKLDCIKSGKIDALLCWFELDLDENTTITTNPLDENRIKCWEQAVFYLPHPVYLNQGEEITFKTIVLDNLLRFNPVSHNEKCHKCWLVQKDIVSFLNDGKLVSYISEIAKKIELQPLNVPVLDFSAFPLFGLIMAKKGATIGILKQETDSKYSEFLNHIFTLNNISTEKVGMVSLDKLGGIPAGCLSFYLPIEVDGSLSMHVGKENTVLNPLRLCFQLIYSLFIDTSNVVKDENVFNFKISKFINEFTGGEHPNLENLEYTQFSDTIMQELNGTDIDITVEVPITKYGQINAVYTWFEISYDGLVFSTLDSSHYKKCAYLLDPKSVSTGDVVTLDLRIQEPYIDFKVR